MRRKAALISTAALQSGAQRNLCDKVFGSHSLRSRLQRLTPGTCVEVPEPPLWRASHPRGTTADSGPKQPQNPTEKPGGLLR